MTRLLVALALVIGFAAPLPAHAAGCDGVTVVVDFRGLGGGVQQGCAPGDQASGVAALIAAGFGYTYASRQPGFVCRVNGKPDTDKCVNTSPSTAYWSYWHASAGGSWSYSSQGAATYVPPRGSVEGWAFGAGEQPGIAPPAAPAPAPQPPAPQPPAPQQPPAGQPPVQQPPAVTTTTTPPSSPPAPSSQPAPSSTASSTTSSAGQSSAVVIDTKSQQAQEKSGTGWWTAIGVLAIAALVVAGLMVARRRRSAEDA